ncbi:MAG: D-2-hydroxyacid dehydrogenase [Opitutaceae bacterium]
MIGRIVKAMIVLLKEPGHLIPAQVDRLHALAGPRPVRITPDLDPLADDFDRIEILAGFLGPNHLARLPALRWVQVWSAGVNNLVTNPSVMAADYTITTTSGIHAIPMGEQILGYMTAFARGLPRAMRAQVRGVWDDDPWAQISELHDRTVLILGAGAIGCRTAELCLAFGMKVIGVRRDPVKDAEPRFPVHPVSQLDELLPQADYLVNALPLTAGTRNLIDSAAIARLKPGAFFINIGRGKTVDEPALIEALRSGHLGGAGLDVFTEEPLPAASPLWTMENVIITRHYAGSSPRYDERAMELFLENLERFISGKSLRNQVDRHRGY